MPGVKISALPAGSNVDNANLLAAVQGGVTNQITVQQLLTGNGSLTTFGLFQSGGIIGIGNTGGLEFVSGSGAATFFETDSNEWLGNDGAGNIVMLSYAGGSVTLGVNGGSSIIISGDGSTLQILTDAGTSVFITYQPVDSSKWAGDPTRIHDALDRLAAVVGAVTPIP